MSGLLTEFNLYSSDSSDSSDNFITRLVSKTPEEIQGFARQDVRSDWICLRTARNIIDAHQRNEYIERNLTAYSLRNVVWQGSEHEFYRQLLNVGKYTFPATRSFSAVSHVNSLASAIGDVIAQKDNPRGSALASVQLGLSVAEVASHVPRLAGTITSLAGQLSGPLSSVVAAVNLTNFFYSDSGRSWFGLFGAVGSLVGSVLPGPLGMAVSWVSNWLSGLDSFKAITALTPPHEVDEAISYAYNARARMEFGVFAQKLAAVALKIATYDAALVLYRSTYIQHAIMYNKMDNGEIVDSSAFRGEMAEIVNAFNYEIELALHLRNSEVITKIMYLYEGIVNLQGGYLSFRDDYIKSNLLPSTDAGDIALGALQNPLSLAGLAVTKSYWEGRLATANPNPISINAYYSGDQDTGNLLNQATSPYMKGVRDSMYRRGSHGFNPEVPDERDFPDAGNIAWSIITPTPEFTELKGRGPAGKYALLHFPFIRGSYEWTNSVKVNPAGWWSSPFIADFRSISDAHPDRVIELFYKDNPSEAQRPTGVILTAMDMNIGIPVVVNGNFSEWSNIHATPDTSAGYLSKYMVNGWGIGSSLQFYIEGAYGGGLNLRIRDNSDNLFMTIPFEGHFQPNTKYSLHLNCYVLDYMPMRVTSSSSAVSVEEVHGTSPSDRGHNTYQYDFVTDSSGSTPELQIRFLRLGLGPMLFNSVTLTQSKL